MLEEKQLAPKLETPEEGVFFEVWLVLCEDVVPYLRHRIIEYYDNAYIYTEFHYTFLKFLLLHRYKVDKYKIIFDFYGIVSLRSCELEACPCANGVQQFFFKQFLIFVIRQSQHIHTGVCSRQMRGIIVLAQTHLRLQCRKTQCRRSRAGSDIQQK